MTTLAGLILVVGLLPLLAGMLWLGPPWWPGQASWRALISSALLCTLGFNLTFLWQELWLVIPKALTPGLHPVLYHNNHDWTGDAPDVDLLQGTGALATLGSGLLAASLLRRVSRASPGWRLFVFWMAFQGLVQGLTQFVVGALVPANDVGRALTWLGIAGVARYGVLVAAVVVLGLVGVMLARRLPIHARRPGVHPLNVCELLVPAVASVLLVIPFREPRDFVEVMLIPLLVMTVGSGWLLVGAARVRTTDCTYRDAPGIAGPALALLVVLFVFQVLLRPGVAF